MWAGVTGFFDGINLYESGAKLLDTFVDGIKSMASAPIKAVEDVLAKVREYLPFSDAHTGPLSQLTLSGTRMMTTIGEGVGQGAPGLVGSVSGALSKAGAAIGSWWAGLSGAERKMAVDVPGAQAAPAQTALTLPPQISVPSVRDYRAPDSPDITVDERQSLSAREGRQSERSAQQSWTVTIQNLYLPSVEKAEDFAAALKGEMEQYGEA